MYPKKKNVEDHFFRGFTLEDMIIAESSSFVIQIGSDFYCNDGNFTFSKKEAEVRYNQIVTILADILNTGDKHQIEEAEDQLIRLFILPLRIQ